MVMRKVRIPGKVMLSGEYAVLYGGTAVLVPVPCYLEITEVLTQPEKPYPRVIDVGLKYKIPETLDHESKFGLPHLHTDPRQFYIEEGTDGESTKLGLGLSAAEAVGVVAIRYERAGLALSEHKVEVARHALNIHSIAQSGLGSGADVVLCAYREPIRFRSNGENFQVELIRDTHPTNIIPISLVWAGQPADTRELVKRFQTWVEKGRNNIKEIVSRLVKISDELAKTWFVSSKQHLFDLLDEFEAVMEDVTCDANLQYKPTIYEKLKNWARRHGGYAKPAGAGGGDMILIIGDLPFHELNQLVIPLEVKSLFSGAGSMV
jgi:mevalonate kinase